MAAKVPKILIAEDDQFIKNILSYRLREDGFEVDLVADGKAAYKKIQQNDYALAVLDLIMPVMNGFEVLRALKKIKNKIPVVVFSNLSQSTDKKEVMALGAKEFFVKSDIAIAEVAQKLRQYMRK